MFASGPSSIDLFFWYEVDQARASLDDKRGDRLTETWQLWGLGFLWQFENSDFDYAIEQIGHRTHPDDKLVALSLAFRLYVGNSRDPEQLKKMNDAVAGNCALEERLAKYLSPPPEDPESYSRIEARERRRQESREREQAKNREDWRKYLRENVDSLRNSPLKSGELSNDQCYLYDRMREKRDRSDGRSNGDWKYLVDEFGEDVARAYRDGLVKFWRGLRPKLRSEGAPPNSTPWHVILGLVGLQIEANETPNWSTELSQAEAELACRYAMHELNGFPNWLPALFSGHPSTVSGILHQELRYELSIEKADVESYYILHDLSWFGQWTWNELAPEILSIVSKKEPVNSSNLRCLTSIVQGSSISDLEIAKLASRKSKTLRRPEHLAHWFAVWVGVQPEVAIPALVERLGKMTDRAERTSFAMRFIACLMGEHRHSPSNVRKAFLTPAYLKALYLLMHDHIRASEDIDRAGTGAYSPGMRDNAQDARNKLGDLLRHIPGKEAFVALSEIATSHPEEAYKPWFAMLAKTKAETDSDIGPWSSSQFREFHDRLERTPRTHRDLAELVHLRLRDMKDDFENGDSSVAKILQLAGLIETDLRTFLGRELREKSFGRYSIPQEEELADAKRPDLRFHGVNFDGPVPAELKVADSWSGPELIERLENQLCGDYLRDNRSNCGFFVLVYQGKKTSWEIPNVEKPVDFDGLVHALENHWRKISINYAGVEHIEIVGIDLTKRSNKSQP